MKAFGRAVGGESAVGGVKLEVRLPHRTSVDDATASVAAGDAIEWYAPVDLVTKFADDDVMSQQLVDGSILRVNGSRAQLVLAGAR